MLYILRIDNIQEIYCDWLDRFLFVDKDEITSNTIVKNIETVHFLLSTYTYTYINAFHVAWT